MRHETNVGELGKRRPDREGLSKSIGNPAAEVFELNRPATAAKRSSGPVVRTAMRIDTARSEGDASDQVSCHRLANLTA